MYVMYTGFFVVSYAMLCYPIFLSSFCDWKRVGRVSKSRHWVGGIFLIVRMGFFVLG